MKLTILFLGRNGAGPKYSFEMTKALSSLYPKYKFQIIIPSTIDNKACWIELNSERKNMSIEFVSTYSSKLEFLFSVINIFKYKKIAKIIKNFQPDWIYLPMGSLLNAGVFLFLKKFKKIYTLHDPNLHRGEESFFIESIRKIEIRNSNRLVILNHFFKTLVANKYNFPVENISVIPHSGFLSKIQPLYHNAFQYKILFLGRIEKYKGVDILLESFCNTLKYIPSLKLIIAGKGNLAPYQIVVNKIPKENIEIYNDWLTEEEIEKFLQECDLVVLPYIDASQSGVIPLAFGNGRTVIATNVGALAEQVPISFGFLTEPNILAIEKKILEVYGLGNIELIKRNVQARNFAEKNLTWESAAQKLINDILCGSFKEIK